jgi:hypothetical protein
LETPPSEQVESHGISQNLREMPNHVVTLLIGLEYTEGKIYLGSKLDVEFCTDTFHQCFPGVFGRFVLIKCLQKLQNEKQFFKGFKSRLGFFSMWIAGSIFYLLADERTCTEIFTIFVGHDLTKIFELR